MVTGQATSRAMAGCAALALYFLAVAVVGEWDLAVAGAVALFAGVLCGGIAYITGVMAWEMLRALGGGLVKAEYSKNRPDLPAGRVPQPRVPLAAALYLYQRPGANADGHARLLLRELQGAATAPLLDCQWQTSQPAALWQTLFSPALLIVAVPAALAAAAFALAAVPGALIAAIIGVPLG
ncbi:hypothetical protein [Actinomadura luteofluorescens]|uniref:hypothetical protein n=1 Tax=Actinomadura luteofluorescens TaxID=46163 RepID=UPI003D8EE74E